MVRVQELLSLPAFASFALAAGEQGLTGEVRNVTILDYENDLRDYDVFARGDFVLASMFFAKDNPVLAIEALYQLIRRDIAALAIKKVYYRTLPDTLRAVADKARVPVFLYDGVAMEDVIVAANDYMRHRRTLAEGIRRLDRLLGVPEEPPSPERAAAALDPLLMSRCVAAFASSSRGEMLADPATIFALSRLDTALSRKRYPIALPYRDGLMMILSFEGEMDNPQEEARAFLEQLGVQPKRAHLGVSGPAETRTALADAVREAIFANRCARAAEREETYFPVLGPYRYVMPILNCPSALRDAREAVARLRAYDARHSANLEETLVAYVGAGSDVKAAAARLFQHPNTVRYRLQKAAAVLGMGEPDAAFYQQVFVYMTLQIMAEL